MRYVVEYRQDNYDEPEQYTIKDTVTGTVMAHVHVQDFRVGVPSDEPFITIRRRLIEAELKALTCAETIASQLELASQSCTVY